MYDTEQESVTSAPSIRSLRLGELLVERGVITPEQLDAALLRQSRDGSSRRLGRVLVDMNLVDSEQVVRVVAESVGRPFVRLTTSMVRSDAAQCLPSDFQEEHNLLPLSVEEGWLTVAVDDFTNVFLIEQIAQRSGFKVQVIAAEPENIRETREAVRALGPTTAISLDGVSASFDEILGQIGVDDLRIVETMIESHAAQEAAAADSPIVKLVNYIVKKAVELSASDIHVEPQDEGFRVRYRVDGDLVTSITPPRRLLAAVVSRIKIMAGMDISERRLPQDGGVAVTLAERSVELRISTMATKMGEKVVMRIVDRSAAPLALASLGLEPAMLDRFRALIREPNGLALVTGPTGSGKSTTLYGALAEITSDTRNISTIEDPVERTVAGTNQFQANDKTGFTFARALRSLLRQDPDTIMVGEIRDGDTATLAAEAALTGHLVLSSLHTNDAATAVPRLVNMGVEPYLVAAALRGVLAQRLVRRICSHCRRRVDLTEVQRASLARFSKDTGPLLESAFVGTGCARCNHRGTTGRTGIFHLLILNESILSGIARGADSVALRSATGNRGLSGLLTDGLAKVRRGAVALDVLLEIVTRTHDDDASETRPRHRAA